MRKGSVIAFLAIGAVLVTNAAAAEETAHPATATPDTPKPATGKPPTAPDKPAKKTAKDAKAKPAETEKKDEPAESSDDDTPAASDANDQAKPADTDTPPPGPGDSTSETAPKPAEADSAAGSGINPLPPMNLAPNPDADAERLKKLGDERPSGATASGAPATVPMQSEVFAEDWWTHARPAFEIHGYFRTRAELFHNFSLGRIDSPDHSLWAPPADNHYTTGSNEEFGPTLCTADERGSGNNDSPSQLLTCHKKTQAGANLRFRLNPELHVSDNLRVMSQIDLLDNVVMGSTPEGYRFAPASGGGYEVLQRSGYNQVGFYDNSIDAPVAGKNSLTNSITVKRVWAEYTTPVGELRFGRMPNQWGLGIVSNAGDGYDDDYQSTVDRIMFATGLKPLDLTIALAWDFPNEGAISSSSTPGGQPYDLAQLDDVDQYALILMRKKSPELEKLSLARGSLVVNGGLYLTYRQQLLADDQSGSSSGANVPNADADSISRSFSRRGASMWVPDLWLQILYKKFRFEAEGAAVLGSIESLSTVPDNRSDFTASSDPARKLRQFGLATELEQKLVEDRLRLMFNFGWASGDPDAYDPSQPGNLVPGPNEQQVADNTISTFRFNPAYRVDLILHRYILGRVQGTYYFKPAVEYDFMRDPSGQRLGGGAQVIWSRASEFVQTPGHHTDLGLELDGSVYFQSKDGSLNDKPGQMGGFYTMLQYGVLFPLAGLGYQSVERVELGNKDTSAAQILRWYLGVLF